VAGLKDPISIKLPVNEDEFKGQKYDRISQKASCHFRSDTSKTWAPLENKCRPEQYAGLLTEEFMCCTPHLTSFAVGEAIEVSYGRYAKTIVTISTLNIFCLFFMILGCCLDR